MAEDEWSPASQSELASQGGSVTSVGEPAVVRERAPAIERGAVIAGRYQVEEIIGKGGSGVVLRAFDRTAQTVVALKVLKPELTHDPKWSRRFARELRLGRPIRHPNVCRIFDIGEADGYKFLTMELAEQGTLRDLIKKGEPLRPLGARMADAAAVIDGLAAIHAAGIVHRDVKPDNLLRMEDGRLAISDFGLATDLPDATAVSVFVGTPHYMAPEVRTGEPATTRSDVWALGVVLHEIFYGKRPERRSSKSSDEYSRPPASLTGSPLERAMLVLCERCLAENSFDRPADAAAVGRLLHAAQGSPRTFLRRRTLAPLLVGILVVALAATALVSRHYRAAKIAATGAQARLAPTGVARDWNGGAKTVAEIEGAVHCFSIVPEHRARIVWGNPRTGEEIDLVTGERRRAALPSETWVLGCPDLSPSGDALLYTAKNDAGAAEIRMAAPDGSHPRTITPGSDPMWLRGSDEFVYNVDRAHAAVFSLPTMGFILLSDAGSGIWPILDKTADPASGRFAVVSSTNDQTRTVALYNSGSFKADTVFKVGFTYAMALHPHREGLLLAYQPSRSQSSLIEVDQGGRSARNVGRYSGMSIAAIRFDGSTPVLLTRANSQDAWLYNETGRVRLTTTGNVGAAALSTKGDLLVSRRAEDGRVSIALASSNGIVENVTPGPADTLPDFAPDGDRWVYVDYDKRKLMLCELSHRSCRSVRDEPTLASWPRFSPSGEQVAFVTQTSIPRLRVLSLKDGSMRDLGPTFGQCPPVWSSNTSVWGLEAAQGRYFWSERDALTTRKLAGRTELEGVLAEGQDVRQCFPKDAPPGSVFFQKLRVEGEERSRLALLPPGGLD
jgi:hypothetical protein